MPVCLIVPASVMVPCNPELGDCGPEEAELGWWGKVLCSVPGLVSCGSSWVAVVQPVALEAQVMWVTSKEIEVTPLLCSCGCKVVWLSCDWTCSKKIQGDK